MKNIFLINMTSNMEQKHACCPINDCKMEGSHSIMRTLCANGWELYGSSDGELLFCDTHFPEFLELYTNYKILESQDFVRRCIFRNGLHNSDHSISELLEAKYYLNQSISLRKKFQSALKSTIQSRGHEYFIDRLVDITESIDETIKEKEEARENGVWFRILNGKRIRNYYL